MNPNKVNDFIKLKDVNTALISTIKNSISYYYKNRPTDFVDLPNHKTPRAWENKVLKILNQYQSDIQESIEKHNDGDSKPLSIITNILGGLSKNLDNFDSCWMTTSYKEKYLTNLDYLIEIADKIESELVIKE